MTCTLISILLNFFSLPNYCSDLRKWYILSLLLLWLREGKFFLRGGQVTCLGEGVSRLDCGVGQNYTLKLKESSWINEEQMVRLFFPALWNYCSFWKWTLDYERGLSNSFLVSTSFFTVQLESSMSFPFLSPKI